MVGAATLFWLVAHQSAVDDVKTSLPLYFFCLILFNNHHYCFTSFVMSHSLTIEKILADLPRALYSTNSYRPESLT
jgi:hypothetical protein